MGGALLKAAQSDIETHVIVLTDGSLGGDSADLVATRKREVQQVCEILSVNSLECWDEPDRGLKPTVQLVDKVKNTIAKLKPAVVFFPAPFEPHPDHRATMAIVWQALRELHASGELPQTLQQAAAYEIAVQSPINALVDITGNIEDKRRAMGIYASQNAENDYPYLVEALNKGRTFSLAHEIRYAEGFFRLSRADMSKSLKEIFDKAVSNYWL